MKIRVTGLFAANMNGDKLPMFVIGNSEVSEVLVPKSSQEHATIDTLMNYSIIIGTAKLQGLTVKASSLVELENFIKNL